jgi:hypothetical protein
MAVKNELVWSHSRAKTLEGCMRAYWYTYYGSWGGWKPDASKENRELWVQKKLQSIPSWLGTTVHQVAEHVLKRAQQGREVVEEEELELALDVAVQSIRDSEAGLGMAFPAKYVHFQEHYYGIKTEWDGVLEELEGLLKNLFANRIFQRLQSVPERILEVEELHRFSVDKDELWVSLDVLVEDGQGGGVIIDWKTGSFHEDATIQAQLGIYGLYASMVRNIPESKLKALYVNLRYDTETQATVSPAALTVAKATLRSSLSRMRGLVTAENEASRSDFPLIPEGSERCLTCNFRGSCGRKGAENAESAERRER